MSSQVPNVSPEVLEEWAVRWCNKYSMQEIAKEYKTTVPVVRRALRYYMDLLMALNDKLEARNSELWRKKNG